MSDTEATAPAGGVAPEDVSEDTVSAAETQDDDADYDEGDEIGADDGEDPDGEADDEVEFDFGGNKLRIRKSEMPGTVAQRVQDYVKGIEAAHTRRSQEVAEQRRGLEAAQKSIDELGSLNENTINAFAKAKSLQATLEQLSQIDLSALWRSKPDQARQVSDRVMQTQAALQHAVAEVAQHERTLADAQSKERDRRMDEGRREVERHINGWSDETASRLVNYVTKEFGISKGDADAWALNPAVTRMAYESMLFREAQAKAKQRAAQRQPPQEAEPVKAGRGKGGSARKSPERMSTDEWIKMRNKQVRTGR